MLEEDGERAWGLQHLRVAADAAGVALWSWNVDTSAIRMDEQGYALWDVPQHGELTFEVLSSRIHPEDLERVGQAIGATRAIIGAYEIDFRIQTSGTLKWLSARGQGSDAGIKDGVMFGVFMDVTERKRAEEARELLAGEMSHRVKNLFAVTSALTRMSARATSTTSEMAVDLLGRMTALGSAHDLVRPVPGAPRRPVLLSELLTVLLAPYDEHGAAAGRRVEVHGPDIRAGEASANALAIVIHELATNAIKYGALSTECGTVHVSYERAGSDVRIVWVERGGPALSASARQEGFGTRLIARSLSGQLAGSVEFDWSAEGLVATMRVSAGRLG